MGRPQPGADTRQAVHLGRYLARWRIVDPLKFFQRLRDERGAHSRLDDILDGETRNAVARYDLIELVRSTNGSRGHPFEVGEDKVILEQIQKGRRQIQKEILDRAAARTADLGIELLDLRMKRIQYVEQVQKDVFASTIAERQQVAELFRSQGEVFGAYPRRTRARAENGFNRRVLHSRGASWQGRRRSDEHLRRGAQPRRGLLGPREVAGDAEKTIDPKKCLLHPVD